MSESFGAALRQLRRNSGISQRDLAERINLDFSYISKLENDRLSPPAADTIVAICQVLGVDPEKLLALTGKLPSEVQKNVSTSPTAQEFLKEAQKMRLSEEEWSSMVSSLRSLRGEF